MRDLLLAGIMAWLVIRALIHPWIGIMAWTWVSIMNPHKLSWTLELLPIAAIVGGATLIGLFISKDRRQFFVTPETALLIAFTLWMCVTLPFSIFVDASMPMWNRVMKINFMILVSMMVLYSKKHIMTFVWVVTGSLAFYGVKGGAFTILTGGNHKVWGPEGTFIEGNNEVALALVMIIPLLRFIQLTSTSVWLRRGMTVSMVLCAAAALGSHSRGALLAIGAMGLVLWLRTDRKFVMAVMLAVVTLVLVPFMPDEWFSRMGTIKSYDSDASAMGRINAWYMAWNLASKNLFGGGYFMWTGPVFVIYAPVTDDVHAAHSIYFQVLGEHGFVGLFLFMTMWLLVWLKAGRLRSVAKGNPQTQWVSDLGSMCQVSLVGYAVGGAFLSLAYYDLPYNVLIMVVLAARWYDQKAWQDEKPPAVVAEIPGARQSA